MDHFDNAAHQDLRDLDDAYARQIAIRAAVEQILDDQYIFESALGDTLESAEIVSHALRDFMRGEMNEHGLRAAIDSMLKIYASKMVARAADLAE